MIKIFISNNKLLLILLLSFVISEIIINPIAEFPLNDDWTYAKSVQILLNKGIIDIGEFPAMTLWTHLVWGGIFTKIFGFSFTVLRFSTLISVVISVLVLNRIIIQVTNNKVIAFIACLTLLYNPIYFNVANTFMTDVNFNTLLILICYFAFDFFKTQRIIPLMLVFILSVLIVLLRQYGIIVPVCFTFACLFLQNRRWVYVCFSLILTVAVVAVFKYYESYLKTILPPQAAYKFSENNDVGSGELWNKFFTNFKSRYGLVLSHVLVYPFPLAIIFIGGLYKSFSLRVGIIVSSLCIAASFFLFWNDPFPLGNIFINCALGAETFVQTITPFFHTEMHTYSENMEYLFLIMKYLFPALTLICATLMTLKYFATRPKLIKPDIRIIFLFAVFFTYIFLTLITDSYFDRYFIPLITITLILLAFAGQEYRIGYKMAVVPLIIFFYISVIGTKDYFTLNRTKWQAYYFLKDRCNISKHAINGGFEVNCWFEGEFTGPYYFIDLYAYKYLIQYDQPEGFKKIMDFEFQRYFPVKKDKISIFINQHLKK